MTDLLKIIVEKGGIVGIAAVVAIIVLTTFIKSIKADPLSKDAYHEVLLTVLKTSRLIIILMLVGWFIIEFIKTTKEFDRKGNPKEPNIDRSGIVRDSFANVIRQQQLEEQSRRQKENEARLKQQQEEIDRRAKEIEEQKQQIKPKEKEAVNIPPVERSSGLSSGDCCYIRGSYAGISLRTKPLTDYEVQEINRCKSCSDCWTDWCDRIDRKTYIGPVDYGETVVFYRKEGKWYLIKQVSTGKNGWISAAYAGSSTLQKCN